MNRNKNPPWLDDVEEYFRATDVQKDIEIELGDFPFGVRKTANWETAGPDHVEGFRFKRMTHVRYRLHKLIITKKYSYSDIRCNKTWTS